MSKQLEPQNVDRRLAKRFMDAGQLDEAAYQKHLKSLPDVTEKSERVESVLDEDFDTEE